MLLFVLPCFVAAVFMPTPNPLEAAAKYVLLLVVIILVKNTNPRLRIDQVVGFFWKYLTILSAIGIILALKGL